MLDTVLLFSAGIRGGALNAIAGRGSFITFPALLVVGVPPISANAGNTFASCSGYLSGAYAFRSDLRVHRLALPRFVLFGIAGGAAGAWLVLRNPDALFREAIPWLLSFAMLLLVSAAVSLVAIALFAFDGVIAWYEGSVVLIGTLLGGYLAARYSRRLPQRGVRAFVVVAGTVTTLYFILRDLWTLIRPTPCPCTRPRWPW